MASHTIPCLLLVLILASAGATSRASVPPDAKPPQGKDTTTTPRTPPHWLVTYNAERLDRGSRAMTALTIWGGMNVVAGAIGWPLADDEQWQSFHAMNLAWGAVNLAIAIPALVRNLTADPAKISLADTLSSEESLTSILLLNVGLDVAYVTAGALLWERGDFGGDPMLTGMGQALILQGAFLMAFDIVFAVLTSDAKAHLYTHMREGRGEVGFRGRF